MYGENSLRQSFNLKFELIEVLVGVESLVVYYYNVTRGKKAPKVFVFGLDGLKSMA